MPILTTLGVATGAAEGLLAKANIVYYNIPASGSITQNFGLSYAYGEPTIFSWTSNGTTLSYNISSATTYCGPTYTTSGTTPILYAGYTTSFTASISGTTLSVSAVAAGTLSVGQVIVGTGVTAGTTIVGITSTSDGGDGDYVVDISQTVSSRSMVGAIPSSTINQVAYTPEWYHRKVCCNGNQNDIWEYYSLTMQSASTALLTAASRSGSQSGC
jgi:hypothetical protein